MVPTEQSSKLSLLFLEKSNLPHCYLFWIYVHLRCDSKRDELFEEKLIVLPFYIDDNFYSIILAGYLEKSSCNCWVWNLKLTLQMLDFYDKL